MTRLHRVVLYRGIDAESYRLEWLVKQALLLLSKHYMLKFDFTPIVLPQLGEEGAFIKVDDQEIPLDPPLGIGELLDRIMNALLRQPGTLYQNNPADMPLPPIQSLGEALA